MIDIVATQASAANSAAMTAPQEPYASRMKDFFLYRDDHCCDRLYDAMIND